MENLSNFTNEELTKKFKDLKLVFTQNLNDKSLRDSLNEQLGILITEFKRRNLEPNA
jgi:hypothetical protein